MLLEKLLPQTALALQAQSQVQQNVSPKRPQKRDALGRSWGLGRRKNATARVCIRPGKGKITINKRDIETYFGRDTLRMIVAQPFESVKLVGRFDVVCIARGGGLSGQAGAILLGIARALVNYDPDLLGTLRKDGFMTRDSRAVERKKPGRPKARKRFQFSKR